MKRPWSGTCESRHDKTNKMAVRPAKTQISLDIRQVWSESSLSAWRNLVSLAHSEDSYHTGRMPRLIWVFAGHTLILLVLSCHSTCANTIEFHILLPKTSNGKGTQTWKMVSSSDKCMRPNKIIPVFPISPPTQIFVPTLNIYCTSKGKICCSWVKLLFLSFNSFSAKNEVNL